MTLTQQRKLKTILVGLASWAVALLLFFPIFWMFITSFKTELQAISVPPQLFFEPTFENFSIVQERSDYLKHAWNSVVTSFGATILALIIAIPAAYSMAFFPGKKTKDILLWMLSTKMLPAVGVLGTYLHPISRLRSAGFEAGAGDYLYPDESADHCLDAVLVLQRFTKRNLGSGTYGRCNTLG